MRYAFIRNYGQDGQEVVAEASSMAGLLRRVRRQIGCASDVICMEIDGVWVPV